MAQRKPPPSASKRPTKATSKSYVSTAKKPVAGSRPAGARPPAKKPGKSIVNQKQTPWGLIATTAVIVIFAVGIVVFAVTQHKDSSSSNPYTQPELADAKAIAGVTYKKEPDHNHVEGVIKYDSTPPVGGNHSQYWADCTGTVYSAPIANENAVHMLEHGAIWITYVPDLPASDVAKLKAFAPATYSVISPYPGLDAPIAISAWGAQLKVTDPDDPALKAFITTYWKSGAPETGAPCTGGVDGPGKE